jgi:outer membrane protein OmpA-like peptidoglycan-associated protein
VQFAQSRQHAPSRGHAAPARTAAPRTLAAELLRLQRSAGNAAVGRALDRRRLLAREPQPGDEHLPPKTGPKEGEAPEMTGCHFGWKDGEWVWSCEHGGMGTPDIPADPRKIPGKVGELFPKDKKPGVGGWPTPSPEERAPWLKPPISLEEICRTNPVSPLCIKVPGPKKPDPLDRPVGVFYGMDVLFEFNQPGKQEGGMTAAGAQTLDWAIEHLQADPTLQVRLVGHASSEGTADANLQLSMRRARAVNSALQAKALGARVMDFVGGEDPAGCKRLEFGIWACGDSQAATGADAADRKVRLTFLRNAPPKPGPFKLGQ